MYPESYCEFLPSPSYSIHFLNQNWMETISFIDGNICNAERHFEMHVHGFLIVALEVINNSVSNDDRQQRQQQGRLMAMQSRGSVTRAPRRGVRPTQAGALRGWGNRARMFESTWFPSYVDLFMKAHVIHHRHSPWSSYLAAWVVLKAAWRYGPLCLYRREQLAALTLIKNDRENRCFTVNFGRGRVMVFLRRIPFLIS